MWADFLNQLTPKMWELVALSTLETLYMGFVATLLAVVVGLPIG
ncbi:methionine ABC transporter permease, partial [Lactobacillus murinus]|nr:methionine ABC transporter permease [Ligilactobacillus murinus]